MNVRQLRPEELDLHSSPNLLSDVIFSDQLGAKRSLQELWNKMEVNALVDLTKNDWTLIESKAKHLTFRLGESIITEGSNIDHLYVIRAGSAAVELAGTRSKTLIATLKPGEICGEIAFLGDSRATASVSASEDMEVDAIWAEDLRELIRVFPGFGTRFYRSLAIILAQRLRQTSKELLRAMVRKPDL